MAVARTLTAVLLDPAVDRDGPAIKDLLSSIPAQGCFACASQPYWTQPTVCVNCGDTIRLPLCADCARDCEYQCFDCYLVGYDYTGI